MIIRHLIFGIVLLVAACDGDGRQSGAVPSERTTQSPDAHLNAKVRDGVTKLIGGERKGEIVALAGQPDLEITNCSKDAECVRKFYSVKYCFPSKQECSRAVELFLNAEGRLFQVQSDFPEIASRSFTMYQPTWIEESR